MRAALASAREAQLSLQSSGRPHGAAAPPARRRLAAAAASTAERLHEHGGRPHHISSAGSSAAPRRTYPYIDRQFPRLELVHSEPPVYVVHDFASAADCELLRRQAEAGQLQRLEYDNKGEVAGGCTRAVKGGMS